MVNCLVTGGSGFVGIGLVDHLLASGHNPRIFDCNPPGRDDVEYIQGSVLDPVALKNALRGCDAVFHLAALVPLTRAGNQFLAVNVDGTRTVAHASRQAGVEHLVHLSSSAVYGIPENLPLDEESSTQPFGRYGRSKLAAEKVVRGLRGGDMTITIIRPRTVVGPGRLGIFDILFGWIRNGRTIWLLGRCEQAFQLLSNRDLAEAMRLSFEKRADVDLCVGASEFGCLRTDLEHLAKEVGSPSRIRSLPTRPCRLALRALDKLRLSPLVDWHYETIDKPFWFSIDRANECLGWSPKDSNLDMLRTAYDSYTKGVSSLDSGSPHRSKLARRALKLFDGR